jgi:hypothetical protein
LLSGLLLTWQTDYFFPPIIPPYGTTKLQILRDREDPYGLITPDNTFLGFTSFTHRSIGQTR